MSTTSRFLPYGYAKKYFTYFNILLKNSANKWYTGIQSQSLFDDSLKVLHVIQVLHSGRAVRPLENALLFLISFFLEILKIIEMSATYIHC
jgi:hypothetical protein